MTTERILATYHIETAHPLDKAAASMAGEQTSGTFIDLPGETGALRRRHAAKIERITPWKRLARPACPVRVPLKTRPGRSPTPRPR